MSKFYYLRFAATGIRKNSSIYLPYILTGICTSAMFYMMSSIAENEGLKSMSGGEAMRTVLGLGTILIAIFSVIFLFYTNSFVAKRRKKELGLYNVLGMGKRHIARVLGLECLITAVISIGLGLGVGVLFSKLVFMLLLKLLQFDVPLAFTADLTSILRTVVIFPAIYLLNLFYNLAVIRLSKPIELLQGGSAGEKEPKHSWILAVLGFGSLAAGYVISIRIKTPLSALSVFFLAVLLVVAGTYLLFTSGSIAVLKLLRKNKRFYYNTEHFTSVSGMIYRMKQNAVGLGSICILSTMVLVIVSTTVSLYAGMDDACASMYPQNTMITASGLTAEQAEQADEAIADTIAASSVSAENTIRFSSFSIDTRQKGSEFSIIDESSYTMADYVYMMFVPLTDYNTVTGEDRTLENNEVLTYLEYSGKRGSFQDSVTIGGQQYKVKENLLDFAGSPKSNMYRSCVVIVNDSTWKTLASKYYPKAGTADYYFGTDLTGSKKEELACVGALSDNLRTLHSGFYVNNETESRSSFLSLYGGLFFLGIFLGSLFMAATVLIIYYKQVSEGYDDRGRFSIMKKVGMDDREIRKTIRKQIIMVFFLPLVTAVLHVCFAFSCITKILEIFNFTNTSLFLGCTLGSAAVFGLIYAAVYALTAKTYYRIVR